MRLITNFSSRSQVRSLLVVLSIGLTLIGCASRETRLLTVEQVEARQAAAADKELKKQQQKAARLKVRADRHTAKAEQEQQRQSAKEKAAAQASLGDVSQSTDSAKAKKKKPGRIKSLLGKVWPFGKEKKRSTTRSTEKVQSVSRTTTSDRPSVNNQTQAQIPVASVPQTISHPQSAALVPEASSSRAGEVIELVGVLSVVKPADCALPAGCGPEYSLLAPDMHTRVYALTGNMSDDLKGRLIAVKGSVATLPDELVTNAGYRGIAEVLDVDQYVSVSDYSYYPFISQAASEYTQSEYGCNLLWDKSYSWYLEGKQPRFTVRMTNSRVLEEPRPYLELAYDGNTRNLISIALVPHEVNPCEL